MSEFTDVATLPTSKLFMAAQLFPLEADGVTVRPVRVTTAPRLFTSPTDSPPNAMFKSIAKAGWSTRRRIVAPGEITGTSEFAVADITLDASRGDLDDWRSLIWDSRPATLHMGAELRANGQPFLWEHYDTIFTGLTRKARPGGNREIEIDMAGTKVLLEDDVIEAIYRAFGGSIDLPDGAKLHADSEPAELDFPAPISWEWFGRVIAYPAVTSCLVRRQLGWGTVVKPDGTLWFLSGAGTETPTGYTMPLGVVYVGAAVQDDGITASLYAGVDGRDVDTVWEGELGAAITNAAATGAIKSNVYLGTHGHIEPWEIRIWKEWLSLEKALRYVDAPMTAIANKPELAEVFKLGDQVGAVARGEKTSVLLDASGGYSWTDSLTGDDPEQHNGGILGETVQRAAGPVRNMPLVPVSEAFGHWVSSDRAMTDFDRMKVGGAPLVPLEVLTSPGAGVIGFRAPDKVYAKSGSGISLRRFVTQQAKPARLGQRIEIQNVGVGWDGIYLAGDFDPETEELSLLDEDTEQPAAFSDFEEAPAGTVVRTPDGEHQFSYDLASARFSPTFTPDSIPTVDGVGDQGLATVSQHVLDLIRSRPELEGATLDTSKLLWDPVVGYVLPKGERVRLRDLLDAIMRSCFGWWIETRTGQFKIGTWTLPQGQVTPSGNQLAAETPVAMILTTPRHELPEGTPSSPLIGRIKTLDDDETVDPVWRMSCGHTKNWSPQDAGSLADGLPAVERDDLVKPWRVEPWTNSANRRVYRTAEPLPMIETYLGSREDAQQLLQWAELFTARKRTVWAAEVSGLGLSAVDVGDTVLLESNVPERGLVGGKLARVIAISEDSDTDQIDLEMIL